MGEQTQPSRRVRIRRFVLRWTIFLGALYAGVMLLLTAFERFLIFQPTSARERWYDPGAAGLRAEDVMLDSADGSRLHGWWCPTAEGAPPPGKTILYLHGNAGNLSFCGEVLANWQRHLNAPAFIVDYPGYGRSNGTPSETSCYAAADAAYDWLTQVRGKPAEDLLIVGESLGGGIAVDLASRRPHGALVLLCPFMSMPEMAQEVYPWLPGRWLVRTQFNNLAKINKCRQPILIAHGTADGIVPFSQGERLFAAANEPKSFLSMPGQGHMLDLGRDFFSQLQQFLATSSDAAADGSK